MAITKAVLATISDAAASVTSAVMGIRLHVFAIGMERFERVEYDLSFCSLD